MSSVQKETIVIVWYKRDLRIHDHEPLSVASSFQGDGLKVLPLYIVEPEYWQLPDSSARQWRFVADSLNELNNALYGLGQSLIVEHGDAVTVFEKLNQKFTIDSLYSHQESGNLWTYQRDKNIAIWCIKNKIKWHESEAFGVFRRFTKRDYWSSYWESFMARPKSLAPKNLIPITTQTRAYALPDLGLMPLETGESDYTQQGGRSQALECFNGFLLERGRNYTYDMSSPLTAFTGCSRISPHITFGTVSLREIVQKLRKYQKNPSLTSIWKKSLKSFNSRLHWHCHFIQKLETEPLFETHNMLNVFDGMRENNFNEDYFEAWKHGRTGYPLIDACMRCLRHTGWLNFRMRALLISFSSYHLWLHWQKPAWHLAQCFTDYEPGIHYSQIQMQSGTTGINTLRIYNPVKQSQDQDPKGVFIKRWLPELSKVPSDFIHEPWNMSQDMQREISCIIGGDYPAPIIDHVVALRNAKTNITNFKKCHPEFWEQAKALQEKHGSRRKSNRVRRKTAGKKTINEHESSPQISLL